MKTIFSFIINILLLIILLLIMELTSFISSHSLGPFIKIEYSTILNAIILILMFILNKKLLNKKKSLFLIYSILFLPLYPILYLCIDNSKLLFKLDELFIYLLGCYLLFLIFIHYVELPRLK